MMWWINGWFIFIQQVEHFSKYKLSADDDDSEGEEQGTEGGVVKKPKTLQQVCVLATCTS